MRYVHLHHLCNYANTTAYAKAVYLRHEISFFLQVNVVFTLADSVKVQPPFPNSLPTLTKHLSCPLQHLVDKKIKLKVIFFHHGSTWTGNTIHCQWISQPKILVGQIFDFKRATGF